MTALDSPTVLKNSFSGNLIYWFFKQMKVYCFKVQVPDFALCQAQDYEFKNIEVSSYISNT